MTNYGVKTEMKMWESQNGIHFSGFIAKKDVENLEIGQIERKTMEECSKPDKQRSDWLTALTIIFRKLEEAKQFN
jgi:hypothetical protein